MPVIPGYFNRYDQIEVGCLNFSRMLLQNNYNDFVKWSLAGLQNKSPLSGDEFNDSVVIKSDEVFQMLRHHGRFGFPGWDKLISLGGPGFGLYVILKNESLFRRNARGESFLPYYDGLDEKISNYAHGVTPDFSIPEMWASNLNNSLAFFQNIKDVNFYDVKNWTRGYEGKMGFLGVTMPLNPEGGPFGGYYKFPDAQGSSFINVGDLVTTRIPLTMYASPEKSIEFCLRQSVYYADYTLPGMDDLKTNFPGGFARTVFFEFDLLTGFNVAPFSQPGDKEIIKEMYSTFKVTRIDESVVNGQPICLVVSLQEVPKDVTIKKRDLVDGQFVTKWGEVGA